MKKYKLIALDIDGTLVDDNKQISSKTIHTLKSLSDKNIKIVLSTGRPFVGLKSALAKLNLSGPMITYNGGMIVDSETKHVISEQTLPFDTVLDILSRSKKHQITSMVWSNDQLYVTKINHFSDEYKTISDVKPILIKSLSDLSHLKIHKVLLYDSTEKMNAFKSELSNESFEYFGSKKDFLEIVPLNVNKGHALKTLSALLKIDLSEMVAIGDGENDISMIKTAGLGVAMLNAEDNVKAAADTITEYDNNHDGLSSFLESLM